MVCNGYYSILFTYYFTVFSVLVIINNYATIATAVRYKNITITRT